MSASAQIDRQRYHPLSVGDTHVHILEQSSSLEGSSTCPPYEASGYFREDVLRDTTINGSPFYILQTTRMTIAGQPVGTDVYAVRVRTDGGLDLIIVRQAGGGLPVLPGPPHGLSAEMAPGAVEIGGTTYPVAGTRTFSGTGGGSGGASQTQRELFAADIGPVENEFEGRRSNPPYCSMNRTRLMYATIGGQAYGSNPVADQEIPTAGSRLSVTAVPNPSSGAVTLRLSSSEATTAAVDVYDALGRRVGGEASLSRPAGVSDVRVDMTSWASGIYLVRVTTSEGQTATARLVRSN